MRLGRLGLPGPSGPRAWATKTLPPVGYTRTPKPVRVRSQNTVSRSTESASTVRFDSVLYCSTAIARAPYAASASGAARWAPMLSPVRAAAAFSASCTRCAYRAVVPTLE